ncbi:MAG: mms16 [Rhodospirillales bacterium]|jgi:phasin family protein|nr:mms16 [Rhodospirillales bacterium]
MANTSTTATAAAKNGFFDVTKVMADFRVPGVDVEAVVASQRKNIEALTQANQLAVEGVQALLRRQSEIARSAIEEFSSMFKDFVQPTSSPEDKIAKQAEYSKVALEKGLANARELTELVTKANTEAFNVINKRVTETLDEVRDYAKKRVAR